MNPRYCRALLTSRKIFSARARDAHLSIRRRADCQKRGLRFSIVQSALSPGLCGGFFHKWCWVTQVQGCARRPLPLFRCGEVKVRELLLFVPGTCAGAATWAGGRRGDAVAPVCLLVGYRNDKWLPLGTPPAFLQDHFSRQRVICIPMRWEPASLSTALLCAPLPSPPPLRTPAQLRTRLPAPRPPESVKVLAAQSCPTLCGPVVGPWDSPVKNPGVGCLSLLKGIFLTQGLNPGLLHCRQILYHLSYQWDPENSF